LNINRIKSQNGGLDDLDFFLIQFSRGISFYRHWYYGSIFIGFR